MHHAIRVHGYGPSSVMQSEAVETPKPGTTEALIRHEAIGVNFKDNHERAGGREERLPLTPGVEAAGVIEELGSDVTGCAVGDRVVYVVNEGGAYTQKNVVPVDRLIPVPNDVPSRLAAAVAVNGMTAHYLLHDYTHVGAGTTVLIHGAAGGMGLVLVQWAHKLGARVIGTVSSEEKERLAREAGADEVVRYTEVDFVDAVRGLTGGRGVDLVIDGVGKSTLHGSIDCLATRGHAVAYGAASGVPDPFPPLSLIRGSRSLHGGDLFDHIADRGEMLRRAEAVFDGVRDGWLKLHAETLLPLAKAAKAHDMLESRASTGKIVLDPTA